MFVAGAKKNIRKTYLMILFETTPFYSNDVWLKLMSFDGHFHVEMIIAPNYFRVKKYLVNVAAFSPFESH